MDNTERILAELNTLKEQQQLQNQQLERVEKGLFGDEEFEQDGLVQTVGKNTRHRKRIEKALMIAAGTGITTGATSPFWGSIKKWFMEHIL